MEIYGIIEGVDGFGNDIAPCNKVGWFTSLDKALETCLQLNINFHATFEQYDEESEEVKDILIDSLEICRDMYERYIAPPIGAYMVVKSNLI